MCQWPVGEPGGETQANVAERARLEMAARFGDGDDGENVLLGEIRNE